MKFYASHNTVSTTPLLDGIEITEQQYMLAVDSISSGTGRIFVENGNFKILSMDTKKIYKTDTKEEKTIYVDDKILKGYTEIKPTDNDSVWDSDNKCWIIPQEILIKREIAELESSQTLRRIREAIPDDIGGTADGRKWMGDLNDKINKLRLGLKK